MGTVVVTGASGSLGQRVVRALASRPGVHRVVGLDIVPVEGWPPGVEGRVLDLAVNPGPGPDELLSALEGAAGLVHLAWRVPEPRPSRRRDVMDADETNRRALRRVLAAAAEAKTDRIVHLSSATVYGAWPDNPVPLTEDSPLRPNPGFRFATGKAEAERVLAEWAEQHPDVAVAVLRPAATVGSPEQPLYQALGGTRAPRPPDDGGRRVQFLHVDDLATAVVAAWEQGLNGVFNVAPDSGTGEDMARELAGGVARVALPARLARAVAAWTWDLWRSGIPREVAPYTEHSWVVAPDKLKATGWEPQYTSEEALVATDVRPHWDDLPPARRQRYTLLLVGGAIAGVAGGAAAGIVSWKRRRRG